MADTKREFKYFSLYDISGMTEHFEKMAAKGWLLESISEWFCKYRRIEPAQVAFDVACLADRSSFTPDSDTSLEDFSELAEKTGWQYAGSVEQLQVFFNTDPEAVPLFTDAVSQLDSIHKSMVKGPVRTNIVFIILAILNVVLRSRSFINVATDTALFALIAGWIIIGIVQIAELAAYLVWYGKARKTADAGYLPESRGAAAVRIISYVALVLVLAVLIMSIAAGGSAEIYITVLLILVVASLVQRAGSKALKHKNVSAGKNKAATVFLGVAAAMILLMIAMPFLTKNTAYTPERADLPADNDLPLTIDMLQPGCGKQQYGTGKTSSGILAERTEDVDVYSYTDESIKGLTYEYALQYEVYRVKAQFAYDKCVKSLFEVYPFYNSMEPMNASLWGADAAYVRRNSTSIASGWHYIVCFGDRIVCLHFSWEPSPEQMKTAADALRSAWE